MWLDDIKFPLNRGCFHQLSRKCNQKLLLLLLWHALFRQPGRKRCWFIVTKALFQNGRGFIIQQKSHFLKLRQSRREKLRYRNDAWWIKIWLLRELLARGQPFFSSCISMYLMSILWVFHQDQHVPQISPCSPYKTQPATAPIFKACGSRILILALCFSPPFFKIPSFHFPHSNLNA